MLDKDSALLLVDDSMTVRQTVKTALVNAGYANIEMAGNGKEAMAKITARLETGSMYTAIFLDWNMPEMDGMEFLKICRNDLNIQDVAIIMLTAVSDQKSILTALQNGATFYLSKPVSPEMIVKKLDQVENWFEAQRKKA